jgi:hypothetical protein
MTRNIKRKRGGQPGNQNARKHGFYARGLTPQQACEFWDIVKRENTDPEIIALRLKMLSVLKHDPGNRHAIREFACLVAKWARARYHLKVPQVTNLKTLLRSSLELLGQGAPSPNELLVIFQKMLELDS